MKVDNETKQAISILKEKARATAPKTDAEVVIALKERDEAILRGEKKREEARVKASRRLYNAWARGFMKRGKDYKKVDSIKFNAAIVRKRRRRLAKVREVK